MLAARASASGLRIDASRPAPAHLPWRAGPRSRLGVGVSALPQARLSLRSSLRDHGDHRVCLDMSLGRSLRRARGRESGSASAFQSSAAHTAKRPVLDRRTSKSYGKGQGEELGPPMPSAGFARRERWRERRQFGSTRGETRLYGKWDPSFTIGGKERELVDVRSLRGDGGKPRGFLVASVLSVRREVCHLLGKD